MTPTALDQPDVRALIGHIEATAVTLVAAIVLWSLSLAAVNRFFARRFVSKFIPRVATFFTLTRSLIGAVVVAIAVLVLLNIWSVNVTPAVWSAGIVTAALAFGAQTFIRDILAGFSFLFEDQFDVGDSVELFVAAAQYLEGTVDAVGLRTTRILDRRGRLVFVPNGNITTVSNASRGPTRNSFSIALPWRTDAMSTRALIERHARAVAAELGAAPESAVVRLAEVAPDKAVYRVELSDARADQLMGEHAMAERIVAKLQTDGFLPGGEKPAAAEQRETH